MTSDSVQEGMKDVMRVFPQGVTVVTTLEGEQLRGMTVSAFTSVSLDPPLVLASISKTAEFYPAFINCKGFAVNFLAGDQQSISDRFAGRHETSDRFEGIEYTLGRTNSPVLRGARAVLECTPWKVYGAGDHSLMIGRVLWAEKLNDKPPLVYYLKRYTTTEERGYAVKPT